MVSENLEGNRGGRGQLLERDFLQEMFDENVINFEGRCSHQAGFYDHANGVHFSVKRACPLQDNEPIHALSRKSVYHSTQR